MCPVRDPKLPAQRRGGALTRVPHHVAGWTASGACAADLVALRGKAEGVILQILGGGVFPEQREGLRALTGKKRRREQREHTATHLHDYLLSGMLLEDNPWV